MYVFCKNQGKPWLRSFVIIVVAGLAVFVFFNSKPVGSMELEYTREVIIGDDVGPYPVGGLTGFSSTTAGGAIHRDSCLYLLKKINQDYYPVSSVDYRRRESNRQAAASLGFIVGLRFALGPKEVVRYSGNRRKSVRFDVWQPSDAVAGDMRALYVSDYRRCKKEETLRELSDWRWQR